MQCDHIVDTADPLLGSVDNSENNTLWTYGCSTYIFSSTASSVSRSGSSVAPTGTVTHIWATVLSSPCPTLPLRDLLRGAWLLDFSPQRDLNAQPQVHEGWKDILEMVQGAAGVCSLRTSCAWQFCLLCTPADSRGLSSALSFPGRWPHLLCFKQV